LKLARKERKLGKRSLIDVLSGETAEINAKSDAESANFQLIISAYSILSVIGILKLEAVKLVQ
jgi:outer membrane protein TolC